MDAGRNFHCPARSIPLGAVAFFGISTSGLAQAHNNIDITSISRKFRTQNVCDTRISLWSPWRSEYAKIAGSPRWKRNYLACGRSNESRTVKEVNRLLAGSLNNA